MSILPLVMCALFVATALGGLAVQASPAGSFEDTLSGVLTKDLQPRRYVVVGNLYVPPGATIRIGKGTVLLFQNFTGLHVQGTLLANGTANSPIVFTSKNDHDWNPSSNVEAAPFDWDGIDIDQASTGTELSQCSVRFSVYGIKSQTDYFRLKNVRFAMNGKADLTIKGELRTIDKKEYSYGVAAAAVTALAIVPTAPDQHALLRTAMRYTGLALAIGGCAVLFQRQAPPQGCWIRRC